MAVSINRELQMALDAEEVCALDEIIGRRDREDFGALQQLLSEPTHREYRTRALYALGRWRDPQAVHAIVEVLPELDEQERISAMDALGRLGTKPALEAVAQYSKDPSPQVRKFVVGALNRIGGREAEAKLRTIAQEDPEKWVRELAAKHVEKR